MTETRGIGSVALITPIPFGLAYGGRERLAVRTQEALRGRGVDARPLDPWETELNFDILHVIGAEVGMWEIAAFAHRRGIPVVLTAVLSLGPGVSRQRLWAPFDRWFPMRTSFRYRRDLLQLADVVLAATSTERNVIESVYGVPRNRIRILPSGIDDAYFDASPAPMRDVVGPRPYVLSVGVISRLKGQRETLAAAKALGLPTVFVGQAVDRRDPYVVEFISDAHSTPDCLWFESMDTAQLAAAYAGCAVFVLPSRAEGLPLAALEAQATGARLVLGDLRQNREVFGAQATYCRWGESGAIATAIRVALERDHATATPIAWSWLQVAAALDDVYQWARAPAGGFMESQR